MIPTRDLPAPARELVADFVDCARLARNRMHSGSFTRREWAWVEACAYLRAASRVREQFGGRPRNGGYGVTLAIVRAKWRG